MGIRNLFHNSRPHKKSPSTLKMGISVFGWNFGEYYKENVHTKADLPFLFGFVFFCLFKTGLKIAQAVVKLTL